jgi:ATP synthase F1 gamma subunit
MQLNELRQELSFNSDLMNLIDTLKNVAGAQYHQMEKQKERFDMFMNAFADFFKVVNLVEVEDPLVSVTSDVLGIVVVTSDSGFMGGLNEGVIRAAFEAQGELPEDKVQYVVIGEKGSGRFSDMGAEFKAFPGIDQDRIYEQAAEVKDYIVDEVLARRMGKVVVAYPKALSFSAQDIDVINILPCRELFDIESDSEVSSRLEDKGLIAEATKVIVESSFSDMVEYLAGTWVTSKLYEVFEDSKLAEFSARAMHLEGSLQKVEKEHKKLKHKVFKAVHEEVDKSMRECHSAKMIKEKKKRKKKLSEKKAKAAEQASAAA